MKQKIDKEQRQLWENELAELLVIQSKTKNRIAKVKSLIKQTYK